MNQYSGICFVKIAGVPILQFDRKYFRRNTNDSGLLCVRKSDRFSRTDSERLMDFCSQLPSEALRIGNRSFNTDRSSGPRKSACGVNCACPCCVDRARCGGRVFPEANSPEYQTVPLWGHRRFPDEDAAERPLLEPEKPKARSTPECSE